MCKNSTIVNNTANSNCGNINHNKEESAGGLLNMIHLCWDGWNGENLRF